MTNEYPTVSDAPDQTAQRIVLYRGALEFAERQVRALVRRTPDFFPLYSTGGKWDHTGESWTDWGPGFLIGQMWLFYDETSEHAWRETAEHYCRLIEPRKNDRDVHDLGFLFLNSYLKWYQHSEDHAHRQVVIDAGRTLAMRFQKKGGYLCSFLGPASLFVDIMMNVPLVFYAGREARDRPLTDLALQHCLTSRQRLVRDDGSTAHEAIFDTETGEFLRQSTQQGYAPESCWSRGLAWATYGFATAYGYTGRTEFLATAEKCAAYYLDNVSSGGVPYWDFNAPGGAAPDGTGPLYDSSAAAIVASALFNLAALDAATGARQRYRELALGILDTLASDRYLARGDADWEGVLKHGVYHVHKGLGVDESVIWGDFFFVEALTKALDLLDTE
jgi:unsaturated chondroitin disaccharide hydrolase